MSGEKRKTSLKPLLLILVPVIIIVIFFMFYIVSRNNKITIKNPGNNPPTNFASGVQLNGTLYFENEDQIWKYDFATDKKIKIADGAQPIIFSDKSILVYNRGDSIYFYNLASEKESLFLSSDLPNYNAEKFSPDSKYIVTDYGTSPARSKTILSVDSAQNKAEFGVSGRYDWLDNDKVVFTDIDYNLVRPFESSGLGLSIINLSSQKTTLKIPDATTDYSYVRTKDNIIYFEKDSVESNSDWKADDKISTTYWSIDSNGQNAQELSEEEFTEEDLNSEIQKLLPAKYQDKNHYQIFNATRSGNIAIFEFYQDEYGKNNNTTKLENGIATIDLTKPESFRTIFNGRNPIWIY